MSLHTQSTAGGILRGNSGVRLNKAPAPSSAALYPDDLIETGTSSAARIETNGSMADINPETMVQFEGAELVLDHGTVSVHTSRALRVRVGCITVVPVKDTEWTRYEVTDLDGKVTVSAFQSDVNIDARLSNARPAAEAVHSTRATVHEGEQKSRDEKCVAADLKDEAPLSAHGAILNSPWARGAGLAAIGVLTCWALCRSDDPISPANPAKY